MDSFLFSFINSFSNFEIGQSVAVLLSQVLVWGIAMVVFAVVLMKRALYPLQQRLLFFVLCVLSTLAVVYVFKIVAPRQRPFVYEKQAIVAIEEPNPMGSFPSSHTAVAMALATVFVIVYPLTSKNVKAGFIIAALFVGIGRVMVGVHYPSDALVGFFIGGLIPYIISRTKMVS
ncbi:MAG TPA: phosphatase PAP2 family protein [Patescibacteria group bacterium]|nr:phosphatase PAP2 family protein [Patescibacteria group bacterium]